MKKLLLMLALALAAQAVASAQAKEGNLENGKRLYQKNGCYQCHGWAGQGGAAGARLSQIRFTLPAFTAFVRNPPSGGMPPYRAKVMTDQEMADVYAYIKSFPEPRPAKDIPLLNE